MDEKKLVTVWLTKADKRDQQIQERLKDIYAQYKKKKYLVAVFESGENDLHTQTRDLLSYNKRHSAEVQVRKRKQVAAER